MRLNSLAKTFKMYEKKFGCKINYDYNSNCLTYHVFHKGKMITVSNESMPSQSVIQSKDLCRDMKNKVLNFVRK